MIEFFIGLLTGMAIMAIGIAHYDSMDGFKCYKIDNNERKIHVRK
jgi:hypothetical protein